MAVSKVILNGTTLMDVTVDTVTASTLASGYQATGADGQKVTGTHTDWPDGDLLGYGDVTSNLVNVGTADYMKI